MRPLRHRSSSQEISYPATRAGNTSDSQAARSRRAHKAHKRFLAIIEAGEEAGAQQFWRDHLDAIGKYYQQGDSTPVDTSPSR